MESIEGSSSSSSSIEKSQVSTNENYTIVKALKNLEQTNPWIQQAIQQALLTQKAVQQTLDTTLEATSSRISQFRSTASAHFNQTLESVKDVKAEYDAYEAKFFGKVKEGAVIAVSHPFIATGAAVGVGFLVLKGPRRFLYYKTLRLFSSEEALLSRADAKMKELKQSFERLKAESEKIEVSLNCFHVSIIKCLERRALQAEEEMKRGRTKLRHAGTQIRKAVSSTDKIEKQARGLKHILAELPGREASKFNSQVKSIVAEAKQERKALSKEVTKISNYGISI